MDQDKCLPRLIRRGNYDRIKEIINEGGGDLTSTYEGRTLLGLAAEVGYIPVVKLFLDEFKNRNQQTDYQTPQPTRKSKSRHTDSKRPKKLKNADKPNIGYFTVVHDEQTTSTEESTEAATPEGMEALEWDTEIKDNQPNEIRDEMTALYRWYAQILDKAADMLNTPLPFDINQTDGLGLAAIHYAAQQGHVETVELLLKYGCRVNVMTDSGVTPLHYACQARSVEVVKVLLDHDAYTDMVTRLEGTPLHVAARINEIQIAELIIKHGADINIQATKDMTPLHVAIQNGNVNFVRLLLQHGARVNLEDAYGTNPLCEAVWLQDVEMTRLLLEAGAKITQSHFLLHSAVFCHNKAIAKMLLEAGSIPNLTNSFGEPAIFAAIRSADIEMVQLLVEYGANINQLKLTGKNVVHEIVDSLEDKRQFHDMLEFLISNGVNILYHCFGQSPISSAIYGGKAHMAGILITRGLDMACVDALTEEQVLGLARIKKLFVVCKLLVWIGVNVRHSCNNLPYCLDNYSYDLGKCDGWLAYYKYNPLSLGELCRIQIRKKVKYPVYKNLEFLPLPRHLISFLLMDYDEV